MPLQFHLLRQKQFASLVVTDPYLVFIRVLHTRILVVKFVNDQWPGSISFIVSVEYDFVVGACELRSSGVLFEDRLVVVTEACVVVYTAVTVQEGVLHVLQVHIIRWVHYRHVVEVSHNLRLLVAHCGAHTVRFRKGGRHLANGVLLI